MKPETNDVGLVVKQIGTPIPALKGLSTGAVADLAALTSDITLTLDSQGVILDCTSGNDYLTAERLSDWIGMPWIDTVRSEGRCKLQEMLDEAAKGRIPRPRQVNHPSPTGTDLPVLYSLIPVSSGDGYVAMGRDYRALAALQQQLIAAQQSVERDYMRLRHAETRYRLLFNVASEAMIIIDANSRKIMEANPAAADFLGAGAGKLIGGKFPQVLGLDGEEQDKLDSLLETVRLAGRADARLLHFPGRDEDISVSATLFRQEASSFLLIRLYCDNLAPDSVAIPKSRSKLLELVEAGPDGFVVTSPDGTVLSANQSFIDSVEASSEEQVCGQSFGRWLARSDVDLNVLIASLKQRGSISLFATTLEGEFGARTEAEISGVACLKGHEPCLGFMIRNVGRRLREQRGDGQQPMPQSPEQLTELVGRVSLRDIVRETTDLIERLCIETALEMTGDNRASAAELLGLSRQSLYVKLRRHNLVEDAAGAGD